MAQYYFEDCCTPGNIYLIDNITGSFSTGQVSLVYATGITTSFSGCASVTSSTSSIASLTAVTNTTAYTNCDQCQVYNAQPSCCPCLFPTTITLSTGGIFTGALAQITFSAQTGGTSVNLGTYTLPHNYTSCNYIGTYDLYFSAYNKHCYVDVTGVTPCDILFRTGPASSPSGQELIEVFIYDVTGNTSSSVLFFNNSGNTSTDIAHTQNKFWAAPMSSSTSNNSIYEWNITLSPFTPTGLASPNRIIEMPAGVSLGAGLGAINDTYIIGENTSTSPHQLIEINLSGLTAVTKTIATLSANTSVSGDIIYTTSGKVICTIVETGSGSANTFIEQYDYLTGTREFSQKIGSNVPLSGASQPYAIFTYAGEIYIWDNRQTDLYKIQSTSPYTVSLVYGTTFKAAGASQAPCCNTVSFV
jgi:hypothetical protein